MRTKTGPIRQMLGAMRFPVRFDPLDPLDALDPLDPLDPLDA
jgi:hypothetical protein